ncbi:MAG: hypothetical protein ACRDGR_06640 [bacterium]
MTEPIDWSVTTWEGNRRRQHREFQALSFREKMEVIEQMGEVEALFAAKRRARGVPVRGRGTERPDSHR